ncbi:MAG: helix-turn-helix domain-containing protein [Anaerolineales bacterium]
METKRASRLAGESLPDLLTVEEAAVLLRVGRNQAYRLAREWRATGGQSGIPVIELSPHTFRVPLHALEERLGAKFTAALPAARALTAVPDLGEAGPDEVSTEQPADVPGSASTAAVAQVTPRRRPRRAAPTDQLSLFDQADPA